MSIKKINVLLIEDETAIRDMIRLSFSKEEFHLIEAECASEAKLKIADQSPDIILLDWMLPGISGVEFAKQLKQDKHFQDIPIIMLTAKAEEDNKIKGLESGADDYVTKPFSPRELAARIKVVLRRSLNVNSQDFITLGELQLNTKTQEVRIKEAVLKLTPINYRLLYFFISHLNKIYSREQLLQRIWMDNLDKDERVVDVQIKRLRQALEPYGYNDLIKTVRSSGYQCVPLP